MIVEDKIMGLKKLTQPIMFLSQFKQMWSPLISGRLQDMSMHRRLESRQRL